MGLYIQKRPVLQVWRPKALMICVQKTFIPFYGFASYWHFLVFYLSNPKKALKRPKWIRGFPGAWTIMLTPIFSCTLASFLVHLLTFFVRFYTLSARRYWDYNMFSNSRSYLPRVPIRLDFWSHLKLKIFVTTCMYHKYAYETSGLNLNF